MESTLSLAKAELEGEIGLFLGFGRGLENGDTEWTAQQYATIRSLRASGERQFYFPPPLEQGGASYDWSFLRPVAELALAQDARSVELPDDFGGFEGQITLESTLNTWPIEVLGVGVIHNRYAALPDASGRPELAALSPKRGTGKKSASRTELLIFPVADANYTLRFQYYILPDCLTGDRPYAYGGAAHAETLKASCLAAAEIYLDNEVGPMSANWMSRLAASISLDRRSKPQKIGYNADRSDRLGAYWRGGRHWYNGVTYNGIPY